MTRRTFMKVICITQIVARIGDACQVLGMGHPVVSELIA